ncbi:hypothetical protein AC1031_002407 [Aphanomyces cochlioides]|nr:hypothetical protein AC1031_002407 [Aphanomyces cochlioides]
MDNIDYITSLCVMRSPTHPHYPTEPRCKVTSICTLFPINLRMAWVFRSNLSLQDFTLGVLSLLFGYVSHCIDYLREVAEFSIGTGHPSHRNQR